jgi:hypothetical protein
MKQALFLHCHKIGFSWLKTAINLERAKSQNFGGNLEQAKSQNFDANLEQAESREERNFGIFEQVKYQNLRMSEISNSLNK